LTARRSIIPFFIPHYGCEYECVFCNQRKISGIKEPVSVERLCADINKVISDTTDARHLEIALYGGSFTALPVRQQLEYLTAIQSIIGERASFSVRISTRPDYIDLETVERLKLFGVKTVELGAQSMCEDVLLLSKRGHTPEDVVIASNMIKSAGVSLVLQMMTGLLGDTAEKSVYTAKEIVRLAPDGVRIYPAVVVRDTELYDLWKKKEYKEHTVSDAVELGAELCVIFDEADIPIIRLGLNPTDELSGGQAVAGAYHPAFGELVYSRVCLNMAMRFLDGVEPGCDVVISVSRGFMSKMVGMRRQNVKLLVDKYSLGSLKVVEVDIAKISRNMPGMIVSKL